MIGAFLRPVNLAFVLVIACVFMITGCQITQFNLNQARNAKGEPFVDPIKSRWFNNLVFRQAVAYAINRDRMKTNIYRGLGELQHSPVEPNLLSLFWQVELKGDNQD